MIDRDVAVGKSSDLALLRKLKKLCRAHWETSDDYVIFDGEIEDDSPDAMARLYFEIADRMIRYTQLSSAKRQDRHMGALAMEELLKLARVG
jgi:hypothetical protein